MEDSGTAHRVTGREEQKKAEEVKEPGELWGPPRISQILALGVWPLMQLCSNGFCAALSNLQIPGQGSLIGPARVCLFPWSHQLWPRKQCQQSQVVTQLGSSSWDLAQITALQYSDSTFSLKINQSKSC